MKYYPAQKSPARPAGLFDFPRLIVSANDVAHPIIIPAGQRNAELAILAFLLTLSR